MALGFFPVSIFFPDVSGFLSSGCFGLVFRVNRLFLASQLVFWSERLMVFSSWDKVFLESGCLDPGSGRKTGDSSDKKSPGKALLCRSSF